MSNCYVMKRFVLREFSFIYSWLIQKIETIRNKYEIGRNYIKDNSEKKSQFSVLNLTTTELSSRFENFPKRNAYVLSFFPLFFFFRICIAFIFVANLYYFFARLFTRFVSSDFVRFYSSPFRFFHVRAYLPFDRIFIREFEWIPFGKKKIWRL